MRPVINWRTVELDPKDDDDRALLKALPSIGSALIPLLAHGEERIVVLFSTRRRASFMRALPARTAAAEYASKDPALATALDTAPRKLIRLISLRSDATFRIHDVPAADLIEAEDTLPA